MCILYFSILYCSIFYFCIILYFVVFVLYKINKKYLIFVIFNLSIFGIFCIPVIQKNQNKYIKQSRIYIVVYIRTLKIQHYKEYKMQNKIANTKYIYQKYTKYKNAKKTKIIQLIHIYQNTKIPKKSLK